FSEECCEHAMLHLTSMPHLHSLSIFRPPERQILAISRAGEFASMRRLAIHQANLSGKYGEAFCQLKAPRLIELWLQSSQGNAADLRAFAGSPLFDNLRVLTCAGPRVDESSLEAVAESPCAPELRILRLHCGDHDLVGTFRSLADTALTR